VAFIRQGHGVPSTCGTRISRCSKTNSTCSLPRSSIQVKPRMTWRLLSLCSWKERKKWSQTSNRYVTFMKELCIQRFTAAYFSTHNSALHGRRTATQVGAQYYPMSRPNVLKSTFVYELCLSAGSLPYTVFVSIKARFIKIGYAAEDVAKIRWHREVSMSKPMSDRGAHNPAPTPSY
jgi:hypothetical protein